jgi:hypothetical protein
MGRRSLRPLGFTKDGRDEGMCKRRDAMQSGELYQLGTAIDFLGYFGHGTIRSDGSLSLALCLP